VIFTAAPAITEPVLSATVPERTPFAWPYRSEQRENTEPRTATSSTLLFSISFPLATTYGAAEIAHGCDVERLPEQWVI
jgi:hypothetical protein